MFALVNGRALYGACSLAIVSLSRVENTWRLNKILFGDIKKNVFRRKISSCEELSFLFKIDFKIFHSKRVPTCPLARQSVRVSRF